MGPQFSAIDILEMAEAIERNGQAFYEEAAKRFGHLDPSGVLGELGKMEKTHEAFFRSMRQQQSGPDPMLSPYDRNHEAAQYLEALAGSQVFRVDEAVSEIFSGEESLEDILEEATRREKDSVVFYLGVRDIVATEADKTTVDRIIREEMNHIRQLCELATDLD